MPGLYLPTYAPLQKPEPGPLELDIDNPLSLGLVFGTVLNDVGSITPRDVLTAQTSLATNIGSWVGTRYGPAMTFNGSSQAMQFADRSELRPGTSDFTLMVFGNPPPSGNAMGLISKRNNSTFTQMTFGANLNQSGAASSGLLGLYTGGGGTTLAGYGGTSAVIDGLYHQLVVVRSGTTLAFYSDAVALPTTYGTQQLSNYTGADPFIVGAYGGTSGPDIAYLNGTIVYAYYWKRALTGAEVRSVYAEPYQMFLPPFWQRYMPVVLAGGGGGLPFFMQEELLHGGFRHMSGGL